MKDIYVIEVTEKELTLLFYLAGYGASIGLEAFPEEYDSLVKKLHSASIGE